MACLWTADPAVIFFFLVRTHAALTDRLPALWALISNCLHQPTDGSLNSLLSPQIWGISLTGEQMRCGGVSGGALTIRTYGQWTTAKWSCEQEERVSACDRGWEGDGNKMERERERRAVRWLKVKWRTKSAAAIEMNMYIYYIRIHVIPCLWCSSFPQWTETCLGLNLSVWKVDLQTLDKPSAWIYCRLKSRWLLFPAVSNTTRPGFNSQRCEGGFAVALTATEKDASSETM